MVKTKITGMREKWLKYLGGRMNPFEVQKQERKNIQNDTFLPNHWKGFKVEKAAQKHLGGMNVHFDLKVLSKGRETHCIFHHA